MEILVNRDRMDPVMTTEQFSQTRPVATGRDGRRDQFRSRSCSRARTCFRQVVLRQQASGQEKDYDFRSKLIAARRTKILRRKSTRAPGEEAERRGCEEDQHD